MKASIHPVPSKTLWGAGTPNTQAIVAAETYLPTNGYVLRSDYVANATERYNRW